MVGDVGAPDGDDSDVMVAPGSPEESSDDAALPPAPWSRPAEPQPAEPSAPQAELPSGEIEPDEPADEATATEAPAGPFRRRVCGDSNLRVKTARQ